MKKKILAFILCLTLVIPFASMAISADAAAGYTLDEATKTFTVTTADGLIAVSALTCTADGSYASHNITLAADIDLTGKSWTPICYSKNNISSSEVATALGYSGTFDGAGHTIKGLTGISNANGDVRYQGLIAVSNPGCIVKNVTFTDVALDVKEYAGAAIGYAKDTRNKDTDEFPATTVGLTIQNVHVRSASITSSGNYIGGLIGRIDVANALVENCTVYANLSASNGAGGVTGGESGTFDKLPSTFKNIVTAGEYKVSGSNGRAAGIIGYNSGATINFENCITLAKLEGKKDVGSMVGTLAKGAYTFTNCIGNGAYAYGASFNEEKTLSSAAILNSSIVDVNGTMTETTAKLFATEVASSTAPLTVNAAAAEWDKVTLNVIKADALKTQAATLFTDAAFLAKANEVIDSIAHVHAYDKEVATDAFLATPATCGSAAVYYKSCSCGAKGTDTFSSGTPIDHQYSEMWAKNDTHHWHLCVDCQTEKSDEGEHTFGDWTTTKEPTDKKAGEKARACSVCGFKLTEEIAKLDSSANAGTADTTPVEKSGCGGTVLGGVGIVMLVATGAGLALKKKED